MTNEENTQNKSRGLIIFLLLIITVLAGGIIYLLVFNDKTTISLGSSQLATTETSQKQDRDSAESGDSQSIVEGQSQQHETFLVNLVPYIDVSFSGNNGEGQASYNLNLSGLEGQAHLSASDLRDTLNQVAIHIEPKQGLSNGQTVELVVEANESVADLVRSTTTQMTVSGLDAAQIFTDQDIANAAIISYEGPSGQAQAEVNYHFNPPFDQLEIELEGLEEPLTNGDKFSLVLSEDSRQYLADNNILLIGQGRAEIEVTGLEILKPFDDERIAEAVNLIFTGYNGYGQVSLDYAFNRPYEDLSLELASDSQGLANGDQVVVALTNESKEILQQQEYSLPGDGQIEVEVTGLPEAIQVPDDLLSKHVVTNFVGTSGVGQMQIDTTFQPPYSDYLSEKSFYSDQDGAIENGEEVLIRLKVEAWQELFDHGLIVSETGQQFSRRADNLRLVLEEAGDIPQLDDLLDRINTAVTVRYSESSLFAAHEVKLEGIYYRPYHVVNDLIDIEGASQDGVLVALYRVDIYDRGKQKLQETIHVLEGYSDLFIDAEGNVDMNDLVDYNYDFNSSYSLDSIVQMLKGYEFKRVVRN